MPMPATNPGPTEDDGYEARDDQRERLAEPTDDSHSAGTSCTTLM